jgi:hypothetical protein
MPVLAFCFPHFIATYLHLIPTYPFPTNSSDVKAYIKDIFHLHWYQTIFVTLYYHQQNNPSLFYAFVLVLSHSLSLV